MTPATYRGGAGAHIDFAIASTSLGTLLVAATDRGICAVTLGDNASTLEAALEREYPAATRARVTAPASWLASWVQEIVSAIDSGRDSPAAPLDVRASAFQWKVWRELQKIPRGETRSYSEIASAIGSPGRFAQWPARVPTIASPSRAVSPCGAAGRGLGGYRWGLERKKRLLEKEHAIRPAEESTS